MSNASQFFTDPTAAIPAGTIMVFFQADAPVGWTQVVANNDSMLRVVSGEGGGSGGSASPITLDWSHNHTTRDHLLTIAQMPNHDHNLDGVKVMSTNTPYVSPNDPTSGSTASGRIYTATDEGGGQVHNHGTTLDAGVTFSPKYIDVIQASKD